MKKIADGESWAMPATVEDPTVFEEIAERLRARGFGGGGTSPST
jgi:propionyl-CoA synthetase